MIEQLMSRRKEIRSKRASKLQAWEVPTESMGPMNKRI